MDNIGTWIKNPATRRYLYGIATAVVPLLVGLGVVGAILGGWLGSAIFHKPLGKFWSPWTWLISIVGALIVLWIWGIITKKKAQ